MDSLLNDLDMASRGWNLWDGIVRRNPDGKETVYVVFLEKDRITSKALELFQVFRKEKQWKKGIIITDIKNIQCLIPIDGQIQVEWFSRHDIDCIFKYYSLHSFSDHFYVLSLDTFEQCCLKSAACELSIEEVILRGLFRLGIM